MKRTAVVLLGLALVVGAMAWNVAKKERVLAQGRLVLLELAPRDPRSLMQGDYMQLNYAVASVRHEGWPQDGHLVLTQTPEGVAKLVRRHAGEPLQEGEFLLRYRIRDGLLRLGAETFFFQEGQAERYARARYGELRVAASGDSVLVGLR